MPIAWLPRLAFLSDLPTRPSLGRLAHERYDRYAVEACRGVMAGLDLGCQGSTHHLGRCGRMDWRASLHRKEHGLSGRTRRLRPFLAAGAQVVNM